MKKAALGLVTMIAAFGSAICLYQNLSTLSSQETFTKYINL